MFERYKANIEAYCEQGGIEIPVGFDRRSPARYVAIDLESTPPKLVAMTWSNAKDAVSYLLTLGAGHRTRMLDFHERRELTFNGKNSLLKGEPFAVTEGPRPPPGGTPTS